MIFLSLRMPYVKESPSGTSSLQVSRSPLGMLMITSHNIASGNHQNDIKITFTIGISIRSMVPPPDRPCFEPQIVHIIPRVKNHLLSGRTSSFTTTRGSTVLPAGSKIKEKCQWCTYLFHISLLHTIAGVLSSAPTTSSYFVIHGNSIKSACLCSRWHQQTTFAAGVRLISTRSIACCWGAPSSNHTKIPPASSTAMNGAGSPRLGGAWVRLAQA